MARGDGVNRTSARNMNMTAKDISNAQRHNEREKESYTNQDIVPDRTSMNVHFKTPTGSYAEMFEQMAADGVISTRGLKADANLYGELIFDINSAYFHNHGGYEFAKQFYTDAYKAAIKIVGGEQYILSAVMHADERNRAMSEALGQDVYHYHLHVVYVPVVEKQIKWSTRCKDKSLVGTVKETIMQVSSSKKWLSKPAVDDTGTPLLTKSGKPVLRKSYSILQDDFYNDKKICRYQQYFAIKEIVKTIGETDERGNRQSGVIWHTQGSGKSLTMVMLAKYILMEMTDCHPRVVIVTDRKELDGQIAATFAHTRLNPARATSGRHLVDLVNSGKADVITSIINKFNTAERMATKNESKDVFILVDESHRSNYGLMATKMRSVFPNACYIGFTGTPLMKKEKNTMFKFGKLIHKYTIKDGVDDGAIVPLIYEGRFVDPKC